MLRRRALHFVLAALLVLAAPWRAGAAEPPSLQLEELTWTETRDAIAAGKLVVLVPTGGTEQNGPHMALGKHNAIIRHTATEIAKRLGNALVAPVLPFVPEGSFDPASGHMRYPGTFGLSDHSFELVLRDTATSVKLAGFRRIFFIGDHGESQPVQDMIARTLDHAWRRQGVRVANLDRYYRSNGEDDWLKAHGFDMASIGNHASLPDTAELMALRPEWLRRERLAPAGWPKDAGADGDPSKATPAIGEQLLALKIAAGEAQARALLAAMAR